MPREIGLVIKIEGNTAQIRFPRSSACAKCGACSHGLDDSEMLLTVHNAVQAQLGDKVAVELAGRGLLISSLLTYMLPLVFLILGVLLGGPVARWLNVEQADVAGAILGLLLAALVFMCLRLLEPVIKKYKGFYPQVTEIVEKHSV